MIKETIAVEAWSSSIMFWCSHMNLILDVNMRMVDKPLLISYSIAMVWITKIMTAHLKALESMPIAAYAKPKATSLPFKVTQKGLNHFNSARARAQETPSNFDKIYCTFFCWYSMNVLYIRFRISVLEIFPRALLFFKVLNLKRLTDFFYGQNRLPICPRAMTVFGWSTSSPASPATPTYTSPMAIFSRRRMAKCELRSNSRPKIRRSAATDCTPSSTRLTRLLTVPLKPALLKWWTEWILKKNHGQCVKYALRLFRGICCWYDIETYTDAYLEERLQQFKNTHNPELKKDTARKGAHRFTGSEKKN